ncbi:MAG: adenosine kinase [Alphaproteobacteria bacterium]|nr:adenosine kinase [Alphaproteobacteria bacterium]
MTQTAFDAVGIGNAIVDVLAHGDEAFLQRHGLVKGTMALVDATEAETIYAGMGPAVEVSGGSAANTMAGLASLGGSAAYIGKVRDDQLGQVFSHDIRATGVHFDTPRAQDGEGTARCLIVVTPDAQRTMQTFLGACIDLGPADIDANLVRSAQVTYLEGYLYDPPHAKEAFVKAAEIAHAAGRKVALSLSDPFCVDRHRDAFLDLVAGHIDILFANETELASLYQVEEFDEGLQRVRADCDVACLTRSEKGSLIVAGDEVHVIDAEPVAQVVDTTGAGDLYASGFLYGYTHGLGLAVAGRIAAIAAGEVISHMGARPERPLQALVKERLG